ncbi:MAG: MerR family transcriptional regulator, partial [Rhodospirillaceae bacterium]
LKRGGGRRYYRPEDVVLLKRIRSLLYTDGLTIKGVQKILREAGVKALTSDDAVVSPFQSVAGGSASGLPREHASALLTELTALRDELRALAKSA